MNNYQCDCKPFLNFNPPSPPRRAVPEDGCTAPTATRETGSGHGEAAPDKQTEDTKAKEP